MFSNTQTSDNYLFVDVGTTRCIGMIKPVKAEEASMMG